MAIPFDCLEGSDDRVFQVHGELGMPELLERFRKLKENYVKNSEEW